MTLDEGRMDLARRAMDGDAEAARLYCGAYTLVRHEQTGQLARCQGDIPPGWVRVDGVYDADGFLFPQYWSLARVSREG